MKKIIKALALVTLLTTTGCTQAETVRHNITENADSFNVTRRITVFNTRTDKVLMQMTVAGFQILRKEQCIKV